MDEPLGKAMMLVAEERRRKVDKRFDSFGDLRWAELVRIVGALTLGFHTAWNIGVLGLLPGGC